MNRPQLPPDSVWRSLVERSLEEDLGRAGDITSMAIVPEGTRATGRIVARRAGVVAGLPVAAAVFGLAGPGALVKTAAVDGDRVDAGANLAEVSGAARTLLAAERTALNLLGHLSGIATETRVLVDAVAGTRARIVDTRKTTPGLRALEKYAVRCGGGGNHRFGLDDAILIKDNHLVVAGGVGEAVRRARSAAGHLLRIEVEISSPEQLEEAIVAGADVVMLDNFGLADLARAVERAAGRVPLEASGGITRDNIRAVAETGVDLISVGWITHSALALDVALDFQARRAPR